LAGGTGGALARLFGELTLLVDNRGIIRAIWADDETSPHCPAKVLTGKRISGVLCGSHYAPLRKLLRRVWKTNRTQHLEYPVDFPEGTRWFCARILPVANHAALSKMLCFFSRDITDRKRAEETLRKNAAMLEQSEKLTSTGSWEWDVKTGTITWSDNLYRLRGYAPGEVPTDEATCRQMIHPDDRQDATTLLAKAIATRRPMEHVYRAISKDGGIRFFHARFAPLFSVSGEVVRIVGNAQDITDRKLAEEKLKKSQALLAQAEQLAELGSWEWIWRRTKSRGPTSATAWPTWTRACPPPPLRPSGIWCIPPIAKGTAPWSPRLSPDNAPLNTRPASSGRTGRFECCTRGIFP